MTLSRALGPERAALDLQSGCKGLQAPHRTVVHLRTATLTQSATEGVLA